MKKNYLKTMLAAALLMAGNGTMSAQDTYTSVYNRTASTWTADDVAAWGGNANLAVNDTYGLGFSTVKPGSAYSATQTFAVSENSKIKYEVTWRTGNSTGRTSNFEYIQFGDKVRLSYNSSYNFYLNTDGTSSATTQVLYYKGVQDYTITIIFNTATKSVESFNFNGTDLTSKVAGTLDGNFNNLSFGFVRGGSTSAWEYPNYLTAIDVSESKQTVTTKDYTINYQLDGTTISTNTGTLAVGSSIAAEPSITVDGVKYILNDDIAPTMTIAEGAENVLNVAVRQPYTATLNVTTTVNGVDNTVTTNLVESDTHDKTWSYAYPMYVLSNGVYYKADNTSAYGESGTFTNGETINKTVTYSTADNDVVFYSDASATPGTNFNYSNGESGVVIAQNARDRGIQVGTLPAGNYDFIVNFTAYNKRSLVIRSGINDPLASLTSTGIGEMTGTLSLSEETSGLVINGANSSTTKTNQSEDFDYVIVKKQAAPTVTIDATSQMASYSNTTAVTVPDDVTILIAKSADVTNGVALYKVASKVIPANTGVILMSQTTGEKTLAWGGTAVTDDFTGNILKATGANAVVATGTEYALLKGEQAFAQVAADVAMPANKAYLTIDAAAAKLAINLGEATAINNVETDANAAQPIYNVAGQQVNGSYKGLVIKGGKKFIQK
jgi:hypothetical protein